MGWGLSRPRNCTTHRWPELLGPRSGLGSSDTFLTHSTRLGLGLMLRHE